jgi:hypothetical protein
MPERRPHPPRTTGEGKVDFAGGSGTNAIRLRQAYASIQLEHRVELRAGQTHRSDLAVVSVGAERYPAAVRRKPRRPAAAHQLSLTPGDRFRSRSASPRTAPCHARTATATARTTAPPSLQLGVEYVYWRTRYKDLGASAANRFDRHLSVVF